MLFYNFNCAFWHICPQVLGYLEKPFHVPLFWETLVSYYFLSVLVVTDWMLMLFFFFLSLLINQQNTSCCFLLNKHDFNHLRWDFFYHKQLQIFKFSIFNLWFKICIFQKLFSLPFLNLNNDLYFKFLMFFLLLLCI